MISMIVALAEGNAIGRGGDLLCHMSADLKHFKEITTGHPVLMGRATWLSLPRRPLPGRRNIVLTTADVCYEGAEVVHSIDEALSIIAPDEEVFVLGGGSVYRQFLPVADRLCVTYIEASFPDADTFFPDWGEGWQLTSEQSFPADEKNPYPYRFCEYRRI